MSKLVLDDISVNYKRVRALRNISYEFKSGITALLGPNGSGKSTMMNVICTLQNPTAGVVWYNGKQILKQTKKYLSKMSIQFQNQPMYKNDSAIEYLMFCGALKGLSREQTLCQGRKLLSRFGIADVENKKISTFSGGMRQRLALVGTFIGDPEIILLDEPSVGLDIYEREELKRYLCEIKQKRIIIISTHIVSDVENIADDIVLLSEGKIYTNGSQSNLISAQQGKIWEIPDNVDVRNAVYYSNGIRLCHSEQKPCADAKLKQADLTDVYFSCIKAR